ncbi:hypothetical protein [Candidatus Nitrospira allomarina]|uniref:Uncharacterized protein n=1 Tax=Candidatus Nitrospira allomarina TaxID=3020900 RepID=A0AA96GB13_9BACT|nr:hypothetical protein [Candidatus Nitrospira allomarina]WNM58749.1 hypothetical protein PP769_02995 [Candidatus Nitrospira allomarina]
MKTLLLITTTTDQSQSMGSLSVVKKHAGELGHTVNGKVHLQENGRNIHFYQT